MREVERLIEKLKYYVIAFIAIVMVSQSYAQKKITPVDNDPNRPQQPTWHYYDKHGEPLEEPVLFLAETDTVTGNRPQPVYPLLYSASLGFNFFDGLMACFGQKHSSYDISASVSLFNWIEPTLELGLGFADNHPELSNYRYKSKPSFYGKIGFNYNFLYKSNPDYQVFLGLRFGYTNYTYDIQDVTISSDYWGQTNHFSIDNQRASAFYGQALAGLKVKIWKWFSMGWSIRYGFKMKATQGSNSDPWFIPGYGTRALNATFSLIYTLPIHTQKKENIIKVIGEGEPHISGGIPEP